MPRPIHLLMDRAYEGNEVRQLALDFGYVLVVPPKEHRRPPWKYDRARYTRRPERERLFRRLKGVRRIGARCENLEVLFVTFINVALIVEGLR